ncbi:oxygenase MpaB family protein [Janibacter anophelis]|uniref:oxygenase MpaB family protein n=1 Tax=Janibacter anophelis TaxID=319054 RepID=UPI003F822957
MRRLREALAAGGVDAGAPAALREFFAAVTPDPGWLDRDLVERGARAYRRLGRSRDDALLILGLIGGYRFGGPTELLVATGALSGEGATRRLGETQAWTHQVSRPGGLEPGGVGWASTLHVRVMHALVADRYERPGRYDIAGHGLPINQADSAATLGLFSGAALLGCRALGRLVPREDSDAIMHLWRYVGWLMGVDEDWLFDSERAQHHFNAHILLAQGQVTPNGARLARPLVDGLREERTGGARARLHGVWARERVLSLARPMLGRQSLHDLGLPVRPPWLVPVEIVRNLVETVVVVRVERGRRWLEERSDRRYEADFVLRLGDATHGPRDLPA